MVNKIKTTGIKKPSLKKVNNKVVRNAKKGASGVGALVKGIIFLPRTAYRFLKSVGHELKLVDWLSRKQTARWSTAVIATALALGGLLALSDYLYFLLRDLLFEKL